MNEESPKEKPSRAAKLEQRKMQRIDPADLRIEFPPHVHSELKGILESLREKDADAYKPLMEKLEKLASGRSTVVKGMQLMADIARGMEAYTKENGDLSPVRKWDVFVSGLYRHHQNLAQPMTLVMEERKMGRG